MTDKNIKYLIIFSFIQFYLIGFFLRENIAGGAEQDFVNFTWPAILSFKNNFLSTLINYSSIGEGSPPLFHILNAYLNPFTFSQIAFQGSITLISIANVLIFAKIIEKKFEFPKIDSFLYASVFFILPFFRSSAYWGLTENIGWLFLLVSIYKYIIFNKTKEKKKIDIFFIALFSSLALYTRPYLIFFPIFLVFKTIFEKNINLFKNLSIYYFFLSIPGFYLIYLWGGAIYLGTGEEKINFIQEYHNPKFILRNLVIFSSIFFFYIFPLELIFYLKEKKIPSKKNLLIFFIFSSLLLILYYLNYFDYLHELNLGGGVVLKLVKLFFNDQILFFLLVSSIGFTLITKYIFISKSNRILFFSLIIYCFPKYPLQEYFEPLMIILFFSLFDFENKLTQIKENKNITIFVSYFLIYFIGSYYYRYFV